MTKVTARSLVRSAAAVLALALASVGVGAVRADAQTALPLPDAVAAVGDSITQAVSSAGSLGATAPQNSWSTGTNTTVDSHARRLQTLGAALGSVVNGSVSGARMRDLDGQMATVAPSRPDYLTVLIGGNDVCTPTVDQMTPLDTFTTQFRTAMQTLTTASPDTAVYVVSIPDVYQLWSLFRNDFVARLVWSSASICQSLLANPGSTNQVDVQRRQQVRQRTIDFNTRLAAVCAEFASRCRFDGNAAFGVQFARGDVAGDYFHPSVAGQAKLAATTWAAGYSWATTPPPPPTATVSVGSLTATKALSGRSNWIATVTVGIRDGGGLAVAGATVTGTWSAGSGAGSCVTTTAGTCTLANSSLTTKRNASVTFTVTGVSATGATYDPTRNLASSITVTRP